MYYYHQMNFTVEGLHDVDKSAALKETLLAMDGVKDVQVRGVDRVSVVYDPDKVVPGQLTAAMRKLGIRTYSG